MSQTGQESVSKLSICFKIVRIYQKWGTQKSSKSKRTKNIQRKKKIKTKLIKNSKRFQFISVNID